jgi:beta-glucosidase
VDTSGGIPQTSLKSFQRIALKQGEQKTVSFTLEPENLMYFNAEGEKVWRKGEYRITLGNSSPGQLSTRLGAAVPQETMVSFR